MLVGDKSVVAYPTSVAVYGSPGTDIGDINFVSNAPAPAGAGLSDQLASIMSKLEIPPVPGTVPTKTVIPNYLLWGGLALVAILIWKKVL